MKHNKVFKTALGEGLALILVFITVIGGAAAQTTVVTFDGLDTVVRWCPYEYGTYTIGEDVSTQFLSQGVVFSVNQFAIAYGSSTAIVGGDSGPSGDPILVLNTIDNPINRCPTNRIGDNGVLTAAFVDPLSGEPVTVGNVRVHVADTEASVHVRTLDPLGGTIHECPNIFSNCSFVTSATDISVDLLFPGEGIAKVEFIDEDATGATDGFTLDDLAFDRLPIRVALDIKPGSDPNSINPKSKGAIPVAILTTATFDAATVDPLSVQFGPAGATEAHNQGHIEDVDGDGDQDLVLHFKTQDTGIQCEDTSASLTGETFDGQAIVGSDSINVVGCK